MSRWSWWSIPQCQWKGTAWTQGVQDVCQEPLANSSMRTCLLVQIWIKCSRTWSGYYSHFGSDTILRVQESLFDLQSIVVVAIWDGEWLLDNVSEMFTGMDEGVERGLPELEGGTAMRSWLGCDWWRVMGGRQFPRHFPSWVIDPRKQYLILAMAASYQSVSRRLMQRKTRGDDFDGPDHDARCKMQRALLQASSLPSTLARVGVIRLGLS
jgi:hypothetical protein